MHRDATDRGEWKVGGHQHLSRLGQFLQEKDPNASGLLGVMFKAVMPVRIVEADREDCVPGERQCFAAGSYTDHAVPRGMPAGATDNDARRNLVLLIELT